MNTLVTYDSSSEEDKPQSANKSSIRADASPSRHSGHATKRNVGDLPMIGPSVPSNGSQIYDGYDEEHESELAGSERDMIRYLTQASHPMTEIPTSPPGSPNTSSSARLKHFLDLKVKGVHFNEDLAKKNAFKNPSLLHILMDRAGLETHSAYGTSLPPNVFNPSSLPAAGYKESLLESQQAIRAKQETEKKAQAATGKRTMEFSSGGVSVISNDMSSHGGLQKRPKQ